MSKKDKKFSLVIIMLSVFAGLMVLTVIFSLVDEGVPRRTEVVNPELEPESSLNFDVRDIHD